MTALAAIIALLAQGATASYVDPDGGSVEQGRAQISEFKAKHVSGNIEDAGSMVIADPEFRIGSETFALPKQEFLAWTRQCRLAINQELPPPPSVKNPNRVVEIVWFDCPARPLTPQVAGAGDRYQVRTSLISGGRGIEIR